MSWTIDQVLNWRLAALSEGWTSEPIYEQEDELRAFRLKKSGFVVMGFARITPHHQTYEPLTESHISCWGPDKLAINVPKEYDMETLLRGLMKCLYCGDYPVEIYSVGFAGRSCAKCLPEQKRKQEYRGWCD